MNVRNVRAGKKRKETEVAVSVVVGEEHLKVKET